MTFRFNRVAIVNRGEPAMRLLHAVRELNQEHGLGLRTIAFFTEPDRHSRFVREADEAWSLGSATFVDPKDGERKIRYLDYEALEQALTQTRAEAAWVGWGFVAEHPEFADLCDRLGVVFIGPSGAVMRRVGDKIASKHLAERAGVPVAPWSGGPVSSVDEARLHTQALGFPLMIKATAGGGGRGVRRVRSAEELSLAFDSARSEALKFFGDATVFLERAIVDARHVEVQVLADHHGTCWAVGVRDCTIQRRNQKVVEEAPCPTLNPDQERAIRAAALRLTRAAEYSNAGTVEFLFDPRAGAFYFMEINTRLQVEHPVTEATTGLDLVKQQLVLASGGHLEGEPPVTRGHSIEVRLNAEDADRSFAPAPGRVELLRLPTGPGLRVDTGVAQGDLVAPEFDSMIAKMIAFGKDRSEALGRLRRALLESGIVIRGGTSNKGFLLELLSHPDVVHNRTDIGWLDRSWNKESLHRPLGHIAIVQAALDVYDREFSLERKNLFVAASRGRVAVRTAIGRAIEVRYAGHNYRLEIRRLGPAQYRVYADGARLDVEVERQGEYERWLRIRGRRYRISSVVDGLEHLVEVNGVAYRVSRDDGGLVVAPSPAVVLAVHAEAGDVVEADATLLILEAMKTEMAITAPCGGRVRKVMVRPNVQVAAGAPLLLLEPVGDAAKPRADARVDFSLATDPRDSCADDGYPQLLAELQRLVLGFEIDERESKALLSALVAARRNLPAQDKAAYLGENAVLEVFADLLAIGCDEPGDASEPRVSAEEHLHAYLRSVGLAGKGLSPKFLSKLLRALLHYGVDGLEPTEALDDALVFVVKAMRRMDECAAHAFALLEYRLRHAEALRPNIDGRFRELLDGIITASQNRYVAVNDLAREARFLFYDRPLFETAQAESLQRIQATLSHLARMPAGADRDHSLLTLVDCQKPMQGLLAGTLVCGSEAERSTGLEVMLRRYYRARLLDRFGQSSNLGHTVIYADYLERDSTCHVVATHATPETLDRAMAAAAPLVGRWGQHTRVSLDLYAVFGGSAIEVAHARESVREALRSAELLPRPECISVSFLGIGLGKPARCFTFVPDEAGGYREHDVHPGMHPMVAERLEVWRLENFKTEQLPAPEHIYLFHAVARDNPKDERLFSFVDVPDLTPRRNSSGQLAELPHLEYLYREATAGIRDFQAHRPARDRLHWNRILMFLRPTMEFVPADIVRIARRLAPASKNLGLEKSVVRLEVKNEHTGKFEQRVVHISARGGTGLRIEFDSLSDRPIRSLSRYDQKVIEMRRLGLVYPYEIIHMLTSSGGVEHTDFPPGEFTEYDLDPEHRLVPVQRPRGHNQANVVVGVISNRTVKHPEGMRRVMLLGDASRGMGSLAEDECRRIIAALDLAAAEHIPLEWFPVSSGAKIAMDVGTEALDWIACVLRRLVEYTQAGGEVNVVVTGVNVGGQSYWNAEATMLMHTRGVLIMTPEASMVLTGKRALDYSGGVSAETNQGIGGYERIMGPNGQAQYFARDVAEACHILLSYYAHSYVAPGETFPRRAISQDPPERDVCCEPHASVNGTGFDFVGDVFSADKNGGRKKPFDIRSVMRAVADQDQEHLERWLAMRDAETAVVWDVHLGGNPVCLVGIESRLLQRLGPVPGDGPESWTGGTLFPRSSKKVARALNAASGNRPVVVLANLSGFDGSPESLRELQLEYGAEIGRAVVNFRGPLVFCVISRYHGGAYVVFSGALNAHLQLAAVEGSHASVIGGAPAAAVVFPRDVKAQALKDPRVRELERELGNLTDLEKPRALAHFDEVYRTVFAEKQGEIAERFDRIHSVERAKSVGSLHEIIAPSKLRPFLIRAVERGMARWVEERAASGPQ